MNAALGFADLHDATLDGISLEWRTGLVRIAIRLESHEITHVELHALETRHLACPRREDWGKSTYINEVRGPHPVDGGGVRLEIEMQSGDVIEVEAREVLERRTC
jgi:hypothetical protein